MTDAIKVVYENHWNFGIHLADTLSLIRCGLELAGFRADIEKQVVPGALNILVENFSDEFTERLLALEDEGTRFIVVATEFLTGETFNDFGKPDDQPADKHYDNLSYWRARHHNFQRVVARAQAVWHLSEQQVPVYQARLPTLPVCYLPHGYVPALRKVALRPDAERDIDFLFTGTLTPYRREILDALHARGYRVHIAPMLTAHFHREDLLARTRIALNLRQHATWPHPSNNRIHFHLNNASLLMSERCDYACDLDPYIEHASSLIDAATASLAQGHYRERAEAALSRFAVERPMGPLMENVMAASAATEKLA